MTIRVNLLKSTAEDVYNYLQEKDVIFYRTPYMKQSARLKNQKHIVMDSTLFRDGKITIQDTSASLAAMLANPKPDSLVIDLCAAPGGKTLMMAEIMKNKGKIIAIEKYKSKLKLIDESCKRMGIDCVETYEADAATVDFEEKADLVFADVPCSGMGTLSKHADIKWKRDQDDIMKLQKTQRAIMDNAAKLVKPGGAFVYSTCTIEPEENQDNVEWFLDSHPEFVVDPANYYLHSDICQDGYMCTFPPSHNCDGAFAARFIKRETSETVDKDQKLSE
jgi:16S rRNA (cytosine967-C5)-methyltransferase